MSPGRCTNRKNLRSCQRTILLYSFYFFSQRKIQHSKYTSFQPSARRPQPPDRKWCRRKLKSPQNPRQARVSPEFIHPGKCYPTRSAVERTCENRANTARVNDSRFVLVRSSRGTRHYSISIFSSIRRLFDSSVPESSKELVSAAFPFSTLVMT